nr:embryo-specific protein ATS3B-like [Ipomoea batatas]
MVLRQQNTYWRQQAKQFWLRDRDSNSSFFHKAVKRKQQVNRIAKLRDNNGIWVERGTQLNTLITSYFHDLLTPALGNYDPDFGVQAEDSHTGKENEEDGNGKSLLCASFFTDLTVHTHYLGGKIKFNPFLAAPSSSFLRRQHHNPQPPGQAAIPLQPPETKSASHSVMLTEIRGLILFLYGLCTEARRSIFEDIRAVFNRYVPDMGSVYVSDMLRVRIPGAENDGWIPYDITIQGQGHYSRPVTFYYNVHVPRDMWYGFDYCSKATKAYAKWGWNLVSAFASTLYAIAGLERD